MELHSPEYEQARRKLRVPKGSPVGALMEKSQSMIGKKIKVKKPIGATNDKRNNELKTHASTKKRTTR